MALQNLGIAIIPELFQSPSVAALLIDATGEMVSFVQQVGKTGNLRKVHFMLGTVTTGQTLKASFQDVDATTGFPDGTPDQSGTVAVADGDDNTFKSVTMSADRAVTQGDIVAVVIEYNATVGNLNINVGSSPEFPRESYPNHFTASWAKTSTRGNLIGLEYDDGTFAYIPGTIVGSAGQAIYNSGTAGADEYGLKFKFPYPVKVIGAQYMGRMSGDVDIVLYDSDGSTALATRSFDKDNSGDNVNNSHGGLFSSAITLVKDTFYRLAIKPTSATDIRLNYLSAIPSAAALDQMAGGQNFHLTKRLDAGSWTDVTTERPAIALMVSACDDGVSTGGGLKLAGSGGLAG